MNDKVDLTSGRFLPEKTKYNARIKADEGYEPGRLNITSGELTNHTTIKATMATKNRAIMLLKQYDHQYIKVTTYNALGKINKVYKNPSYYLYLKIGTIYSAEMVPRYGYELVNNVKNVIPNKRYKIYNTKYIYAYSDAKPKPVDVNITRNKHSTIILYSKRGIITAHHAKDKNTYILSQRLLRYDDHYYISVFPDYGYKLGTKIENVRYEVNNTNNALTINNGNFLLDIKAPVDEIKLKYNLEILSNDWSNQHIEIVNKSTNTSLSMTKDNNSILKYDYEDSIQLKVLPNKGYVPGKIELIMIDESGKPIHYNYNDSAEFILTGNAKIMVSSSTKIESGILTINYLDNNKEKEWLGQWDTHYWEYDENNPQVNHYLDNKHKDEPMYGQLSLTPNESYTNFIHNDFKKDTPDNKFFYMNHLEKDNEVKYVVVYIRQSKHQLITVTNKSDNNKTHTEDFVASINDVITARLDSTDPDFYIKGKLNAAENEDIELHGGVLITASPAIKYKFRIYIEKFANQGIIVECNGVKHTDDFYAKTGDKLHAYIGIINENYDAGHIINSPDVIVSDHDIKFEATDCTPKLYKLHVILNPYQSLTYKISNNIYGNYDDSSASTITIDGGENGITKDIDMYYGQFVIEPTIGISEKYKLIYKLDDSVDKYTFPGYKATNVELVGAIDLYTSLKGFYITGNNGVIESKYESVKIKYRVSIANTNIKNQSITFDPKPKDNNKYVEVEYGGIVTITQTIDEGYCIPAGSGMYLKSITNNAFDILSKESTESNGRKQVVMKCKIYDNCSLYLPEPELMMVNVKIIPSEYCTSSECTISEPGRDPYVILLNKEQTIRVKYGTGIFPNIIYRGYESNKKIFPLSYNITGKFGVIDNNGATKILGDCVISLLTLSQLTPIEYNVMVQSGNHQIITVINKTAKVIENKVCNENSIINVKAHYKDKIELHIKSTDSKLYDSGDLIVSGEYNDISTGATLDTNPPKTLEVLGDIVVKTTSAVTKAVKVIFKYPKDNPEDSDLRFNIIILTPDPKDYGNSHTVYQRDIKKDTEFEVTVGSYIQITAAEYNVFKYITPSSIEVYSENESNKISNLTGTPIFDDYNDNKINCSHCYCHEFLMTASNDILSKPVIFAPVASRRNKIKLRVYSNNYDESYNSVKGISVADTSDSIVSSPIISMNNDLKLESADYYNNNDSIKEVKNLIRDKKPKDAFKLLSNLSKDISNVPEDVINTHSIQDTTIDINANDVILYSSIVDKGYSNYDIIRIKVINPNLRDKFNKKLEDEYTKSNMFNSRIFEDNDNNITSEVYNSEEYSKYRLDLENNDKFYECIAVLIPEMIDGTILELEYIKRSYQLSSRNYLTSQYIDNKLPIEEYNSKYGYNYIQNHKDVGVLYIKNDYPYYQGVNIYIFTLDMITNYLKHRYHTNSDINAILDDLMNITEGNKKTVNEYISGFRSYIFIYNNDNANILNNTYIKKMEKLTKLLVPINCYIYIEVRPINELTDNEIMPREKIKQIKGVKNPGVIKYLNTDPDNPLLSLSNYKKYKDKSISLSNDEYSPVAKYSIRDSNVLIELEKPILDVMEVRLVQKPYTIMKVYDKANPDKILFNGTKMDDKPFDESNVGEKTETIYVEKNTILVVESYSFHSNCLDKDRNDVYDKDYMGHIIKRIPSLSYRVFMLDSIISFSSTNTFNPLEMVIKGKDNVESIDSSFINNNATYQFKVFGDCEIESGTSSELIFIISNGAKLDELKSYMDHYLAGPLEKYYGYINNSINHAPKWYNDIISEDGYYDKHYPIVEFSRDKSGVSYEIDIVQSNFIVMTKNDYIKIYNAVYDYNASNYVGVKDRNFQVSDNANINSRQSEQGYLLDTLSFKYSDNKLENVSNCIYILSKTKYNGLVDLSYYTAKNINKDELFCEELPKRFIDYLCSFNNPPIKASKMNSMFGEDIKSINDLLSPSFLTDEEVKNVKKKYSDCIKYSSADNKFRYLLLSLKNIPKMNIDTSRVKNMRAVFSGCLDLKSLDLSNFDTKNVEDMSDMFGYCYSLTAIDLSSWNTNKVINMSNMFGNCYSLTSLNMSNWNTENVKNMSRMFDHCRSATSLDISKFNTGNVTDMSRMFSDCDSLKSLNISNWNTENVTDMSWMFWYCESLTSLDLSNWNTENVINMSCMFFDCGNITSLDISHWNTKNVKDMSSMFEDCFKLESLDISNWNTENVEDMSRMFRISSLISLDLSHWNTKNVKDMSSMFSSCESLTSLGNISNWNTENVKTMNNMFFNCMSLTSLDVSKWCNSNVKSMEEMFYNCASLRSINLSHFGTKNVTDMYCMFSSCKSLTSLDVSNFDTRNVESMSNMFRSCESLTSLNNISNWNAENVKSMDWMFSDCKSLKSLDLSNWNTKNVTSMYGMFNNCEALTSLNVSNWNTENVTGMCYNDNNKIIHGLFENCKSLKSLDLSSWNTKNVTDMSAMFRFCSSLTSLNVSHFDTKNVKDMGDMFCYCKHLKSLDVSNFDTRNVRIMNSMFSACYSLTSLDVSNFDTKNVTDMRGMFSACRSFTSLDVSNFDTKNVTDMSVMFWSCESLTSLDLSNFDTSNVKDMSNVFDDCTSLKYIILLDISKNIKLLDLINTEYKTNNIKVLTSTDSYNKYKDTYDFLKDENSYYIHKHNGQVDVYDII